MLEGVPVTLLDGIGVVGVVLLLGLGFGTGRLFTKRQYDDVIHDRDEWRAESRIKDAQIAKKDEQLGYMREVGEANRAVLSAIQQLGRTREQP